MYSKNRKAFTMIELVFVIAIIGILASVAIPKMIVNRDSAKAASCMKEVSGFITEVTLYYTVYGKFDTISKMSNIAVGNTQNGFANDVNMADSKATYYCEGAGLAEYEISQVGTSTKLDVTSASPESPPSAFKADRQLKDNSFYRSYILGGYVVE